MSTAPPARGADMHTPGPWTLETVRTSIGFCHKIGPFPWNRQQNHACIYVDYPVHGDELLANARLIAAAPDLLKALQNARDHVAYVKAQDGPGSAFAARDLIAIDAAIAKAQP